MKPYFYIALLLALAAVARADDPAPLAGAITIHPATVDLTHPRQQQSLQILGATPTGFTVDLRGEAKFASANEAVATIDASGWIKPIASGETTITVTLRGEAKQIPVKVQLPAVAPPVSFRHEVMPVISKAGCNMGACHGYSLGKNGFKLSLRGADPDKDYLYITRENFGRRLDAQTPSASILVAKPRGDAPHEGGVRLRRGSPLEQTLVDWIAAGAPNDPAEVAKVVKVSVIPDKLVLTPGQKHHLQLLAHYSDGTTRDVTRLGIFSANNNQFAEVDDEGYVSSAEAGETAIVARYERMFAATGVIVIAPGGEFAAVPVPNHLIDGPVIEKLNRLRITPSAVAGDEEFLRRIYLDLIGVAPKPDEIRAFLTESDPLKRERVVDALLDRPEFVDHWSLKWGDLLQNSRNTLSQQSMYLFREYIRGAVAANMPLDEFARKILVARGGAVDDPASAYFAISKDTNDTVERATQVFCGVRMLCARCHDHPIENWTQADYYGLASFFNQVSLRGDTRTEAGGNAKIVQLNLTAGMSTNIRTNRAQPAKFLGGAEPQPAADADRRVAYAQWLTAKENPFFARGMVNRVWSYFFNRGIVEPVDDIRSTNPPINPALLDALTKDFVEHNFDAKRLMRTIVLSQTYQRSSQPNDSNRKDEQNFSHAIPRRIPAEALLDTLVQATSVPESIGGAPGGFRAAQLPDANVTSDFLSLFGKPQRMEACECERDNGSNMLQALHFINGGSIQKRVQNANARPAQLVKQKLPDPELVTELYLWSLARRPSEAELKLGVEFLQSYGELKNEAAQDLMWALLNSKDFLLVH